MQIQIVVETYGKKYTCEAGERLSDTLRAHHIPLAAPCGGGGRCGKCRVQVMSGALPVTRADEALLSEQELARGVRLSCAARPAQSVRIRIIDRLERQLSAETLLTQTPDMRGAQPMQPQTQPFEPAHDAGGYGIAVDIGTTTLAACIYGWTSGAVCASGTVTAVNRGRMYGADVLSRMLAACQQGMRARLQELLQADVRALLEQLSERTQVKKSEVRRIVIAANQPMVHLLMGYACEPLTAAPFCTQHKAGICADALCVLGASGYTCPVELLPAVSAFVGGDIVSGLLQLGMDAGEETRLLLDIGTNGEMALRHHNQIYVTSTAAGPAFEGGGISCGCASVPGAICGVHITEATRDQPALRTIGDALPIGVCGSGVLELVSELLRNGLLDETGLFAAQTHQECGYALAKAADGTTLRFTQKDVRSVQLAKGAIRAGIETLLAAAGVSAEAVTEVFLAGGFGSYLDEQSALRIGLLPQQCAGRIRAVGNSSLSGAVFAGVHAPQLEPLLAQCQVIELANAPDFAERYLNYMNFAE